MNKHCTTIVVGGGAAGLIAAWKAASNGAKVILLEKNRRPGIKILISGGGKCNITNGSSITSMLGRFEKSESRFLKYSFHTFSNTSLLTILHDRGVETYTRENGKVFPRSHDADDVLRALIGLTEETGAEIRTQCEVRDVVKDDSGKFIVTTSDGTFTSAKVIVATGGMSYRKTGTTGDGYRWMERFGHTIAPIRPALAPIMLTPSPPLQWQGTPIRDCSVMAICGKEIIARWRGDMLFTHTGISGPAVLEISKKAFLAFEQGKHVTIHIDFYPELSFEMLEKKIMDHSGSNMNMSLTSFVQQLIPTKLAEYFLLQAELIETTKLHQFKKEQRRRLVGTLKNCLIGTVKDIPLDRGEVTAGGIVLTEVSPTTMESKIIPGLFLCGEILDIAGPVGGYNLQAAFSTGFVAGRSASAV